MPELRKVYSTVDARDRIVEAALTDYAECGFDGDTTSGIAKEFVQAIEAQAPRQ
jgi:hypothetical protein